MPGKQASGDSDRLGIVFEHRMGVSVERHDTSGYCSVQTDAGAVIRGDYGNGDERKRRLGSYYSIVQARVNEMLS